MSVDIDVLDPAFAPATGTAEPGGWTTRELLTVLDGLRGLPVVGADVVEVAPVYDNPGETTVLAAAEVALSLIALMVGTPVPSGPGPYSCGSSGCKLKGIVYVEWIVSPHSNVRGSCSLILPPLALVGKHMLILSL